MLKNIVSFQKIKYLLTVLLIAAFIHPAGLCADYELPERPAKLDKPRIIVGDDFLMKSDFVKDGNLNRVTDIVQGELVKDLEGEIGIAGNHGVIFVDANGDVKSKVEMERLMAPLNFIDVDSDGITEYMARGSWGINAGLYNHSGEMQWDTSNYESAVDDMAMGDIDGDGVPEFVVGFNGGGGVVLLDKDGNKLWREDDGNVWHVEMVDTNGDGKNEIVHSNAGGKITVRDENGEIISQKDPGPYFSDFAIVNWPTKSDKPYALLAENDFIWLFNFDGTIAKKYPATNVGTLGKVKGTAVKFIKDQPEFFAVIVEISTWSRSVLFIYDSEDKLVYHVIFDGGCGAIAALPLKDDGTDVLLVGGDKNVWRYQVIENTIE